MIEGDGRKYVLTLDDGEPIVFAREPSRDEIRAILDRKQAEREAAEERKRSRRSRHSADDQPEPPTVVEE